MMPKAIAYADAVAKGAVVKGKLAKEVTNIWDWVATHLETVDEGRPERHSQLGAEAQTIFVPWRFCNEVAA